MYALVKCLFVVTAAVAAQGFALGPQDVVFHLYTRGNPSVSEPLLATTNSIMNSAHFSLARRTIMTIHSNDDHAGGNFNAFVINPHIIAEDVNVVAVDWSVGAVTYSYGLGNAPQVGRVIAQFINILQNEFSYSSNNFRIVGVGLGGHIAGIAARNVSGNIPHVVAIDPSFHGWTHHPQRLDPDVADTVEVIHTTAGVLGYDYPLGDIDFYPNGGTYQNGCGTDSFCSQTYGFAFYSESLNISEGSGFVGTACESYEEAIAQRCSGARDAHFGGSEVKTNASGIYWFSTNSAPPFARG